MPMFSGLTFRCVLAWALLPAAPSTIAIVSRRTVVEELLDGPNVEAHIAAALQADRAKAPRSIHLSLAHLGLPVPTEVRDLVAQAEGSKRVSPAEADEATKTLNKMLEEQHILLDHKVVDCREKRRSAGEAIQDAAGEVRNLAAETSGARQIIVEATSRIPQDRRSFNEFKTDAQITRSRCRGTSLSDKVKAAALTRDANFVAQLVQAVSRQCGSSFLQEPTEGEDELDPDTAVGSTDSLESAAGKLRRDSLHALKIKSMQVLGCQDVAAGLGIVARKRSGRAAAVLMQQAQPGCKLTAHDCAAIKDVVAEVQGEIADSQARLRSSSAKTREACKEDVDFAKSQLAMETSQASDRSRELGEATWKAGKVGDLANEKDSERQKLQKDLKAITAKCTADINDILYGKMCALQKVRDSLQILAGRQELPEDCQVTDWEEGICSKTCGGGTKTLTRKVALAAQGGAACPPLMLHLQCGETACPKDCTVSEWTGWSACSARCDGGIQERNRVVTGSPVGNGVACPNLVDMQLCNSEACTSECKLLEWSAWSPCSQACGGGTQKRSRALRDEGRSTCPKSDSQDRLEQRVCNQKGCGSGDVKCAGTPMDVVLLLDGSGTITEAGFNTLKVLSLDIVGQYSLSKEGTKVAVAAFAKKAKAVSSLTDDANELSSRLASQPFLRGPGNAGAGLLRAATLLSAGGRKNANSVVLMLTDGRLIDPFLARQAANRLKQSGVRVAFGLVGKECKNMDLLKSLASSPTEENIIQLDAFDKLQGSLKANAKRIVTGTCSAVV